MPHIKDHFDRPAGEPSCNDLEDEGCNFPDDQTKESNPAHSSTLKITTFKSLVDKAEGDYLKDKLTSKKVLEEYKTTCGNLKNHSQTQAYNDLRSRIPKDSVTYKKDITKFPSIFQLFIINVIESSTLVIGLEETLAFMSTSPFDNYDAELPVIDHDIMFGKVFVKLRPHAIEFLEYVSNKFEIIVFCSGSAIYAKPILDFIEIDKQYFSHRIYGTHLLFENPAYPIKFFEFLFGNGRSYDNTVLVEAHVQTFSLWVACGVPIKPFVGADEADNELIKLSKYLNKLITVKSIHKEIKSLISTSMMEELK